MPFNFEETLIKGLVIITPDIFKDERGFFYETYKKSDFQKVGIKEEFLQDNQSFSVKNTIRGLHFQKEPYAQGKLVRCIYGSIWDVAVDLRKDSETYGKSYNIELSEENKKMIYIPPGFAHGFLVLSEKAEFLYKCTSEYAPQAEGGIRWDDPFFNIPWPVRREDVLISSKDEKLPYTNELDKDFCL